MNENESIILNHAVKNVFDKIQNNIQLSGDDEKLLIYANEQVANKIVDVLPGVGLMARGKYAAKTARRLAREAEEMLKTPQVQNVVKRLYNTPIVQNTVGKSVQATEPLWRPVYDNASKYMSNLLMPNALPQQLRISANANKALQSSLSNTISSLDDAIGYSVKAGGVIGVAGTGNYLLNKLNDNLPVKDDYNKSSNSVAPYNPNAISQQEMNEINNRLASGNYQEVAVNNILDNAVKIVANKIKSKQPMTNAEKALYNSLVPLQSPDMLPLPPMSGEQKILYTPVQPIEYNGPRSMTPEYGINDSVKWSHKATDYINRSSGANLSHDDRIAFGSQMFKGNYTGTLEQNNAIISTLKEMINRSNSFTPADPKFREI